MNLRQFILILTIATLNGLINAAHPAHVARRIKLLSMNPEMSNISIIVSPTTTNRELGSQIANIYGLELDDTRLSANGHMIAIDNDRIVDPAISTINVAQSVYTSDPELNWALRAPWLTAVYSAARDTELKNQKELDMHEVIRRLDPVAGKLFIEEVTTLPSQEDRLRELIRRQEELIDARIDYSY